MAVIAILSLCVFGPSYGLFRFFDDWQFVDRAAVAVGSGSVTSFISQPLQQHWSPLWNAIETINFLVAGWEADWFIRTIHLATFIASLLLLSWFLRSGGVCTPALVLGLATFGAHHATAAARYSFDTYSQTLSDLAVWTAGVCIGEVIVRGAALTTRRLALVTLLIAVALLVKEQSLGAVVIVSMLLSGAAAARLSDVSWMRAAAGIGTLAVLTLLFTLARRAMGVTFDPAGAFRLCFECVPQNVMYLIAALVDPVRTLTIFDAVHTEPANAWLVLAIGAVVVVLLALLVAAVATAPSDPHARRGRMILVALAGIAASWFPTALLGHVGELYVNTGVFWWTVLVASAIDAAWRRPSARARIATAAIAGLYVISLGVGLMQNLADMRATGECARTYLARIAEVSATVPDGDLLLVTSPAPMKLPGDYGLYRVRSPQVLIMTGLSPASVRYAVRERVRVMHEEAQYAEKDAFDPSIRAKPDRLREIVEAREQGRLYHARARARRRPPRARPLTMRFKRRIVCKG